MGKDKEDPRKIDNIIHSILWGKSFVSVEDNNNISNSFILRSLSIRENNFIDHIYRTHFETAIQEGILTTKQLELLFKSNGLWNESHEIEIIGLENKEKILQAQIKEYQFLTSRKKKAENELITTRELLTELRNNKLSLFVLSAESRAEEVMRRYMIMLSTEDIREKPFWPNETDFLLESDCVLVYNLAISYYKNNLFDDITIRKIARSPQWRIKWSAFKNGADLFGRPIPDWSEMQNYLVYWSQFYDYVYESMERPGDNVIENDEACDAWIKEQNKKHKAQSVGKSSNPSANKKMDHQDHFVMVEHGDTEVIKKVQEMNTNDIRKQLRDEFEVVKEKGSIKDWKLRKGR